MIDLHTHTTASDGRDTPEEMLLKAEKEHLEILAFTDHNSVGAYTEVCRKRHLFSGKILTGVELNCFYRKELIEMLGYGIDTAEMARCLRGRIHTFEKKQYEERAIILDTYLAKGVKLGEEFCRKMNEEPMLIFDPKHESSRGFFLNEIKKYKENVVFFENEETMAQMNLNDFTRQYVYNPASPLYVDETSLFLSIQEAVDIIHQCGGVALLAHCYLYTDKVTDHLEELMKESGADGLESSYPKFTAENEAYLNRLCDQNGWLRSGGSDHHGALRPTLLGRGSEGRELRAEHFSALLSQVKFI